MAHNDSYALFHQFIETFSPSAFVGIDRAHPLVLQLEEVMAAGNQYLSVANLIQTRIIWASQRSRQMIGVDPDQLDASSCFSATWPEDIHRHALARTRMFGLATEMFIAQGEPRVMSINLRIRNPEGNYPDLLFQLFFFYRSAPIRTVYALVLHTDIDSFEKRKSGSHYYLGSDFSLFRYPDQSLLNIGNSLSNREFEIVSMIETGMSSDQIAEKLHISHHTVNTHRKNMLARTGCDNFNVLLHRLKEQGLL